jgi:hypothetical protein
MNFIRLTSLFGIIILSTYSCATSMTPLQVHNTLPTLTKTKYVTQAGVNDSCKYLYRGRTYTAPIGFTTKNDLQNGAKGIDEWVQLDGGNAYVLTNYKWVTVGNGDATQLYVEFDTLKCD